jgi:hypothetical protein
MNELNLDPTVPLEEVPRQVLEAVIVNWRETRAKRLELERVAREQAALETSLKSYAIEVLKAQKHEGCLIGGRVTGLIKNTVPTVSNKEALLAHIRASGELELLQFQILKSAMEERRENGVEVPGVEFIEVYGLSDKKL